MEYYLAIKMNELLIPEISWKNPQILSLKEKKANPKSYTLYDHILQLSWNFDKIIEM